MICCGKSIFSQKADSAAEFDIHDTLLPYTIHFSLSRIKAIGKTQNDPSLQKTSKAFLLTKMSWPQTVKDTTWLFCLRSKTPSAADRKCMLGINVYSFRRFSSAGFFIVQNYVQ